MDEFFDDEDEVQLNEHEMAWYSKDWTQVQRLSDTFKQEKENVLFSILDSVTSSKKDITQEQEEQYSKYWIDNALSQHIDCIVSVYRMNLIGSELSDKDHFRYYLHSLPKGKRYGKWAKFSEDTNELLILSLISKYYSINMTDAKMYMSIMKAKGILDKEFNKLKVLATDEFIKSIFKTKTEQTKVAKIIKG
ncbi:DNA polymerase clamp loader subunit [Providencia phage PSTRCR_121]|nr:DNA polymerase clamp loader subunit [Providencia phage PSTRCR_121]